MEPAPAVTITILNRQHAKKIDRRRLEKIVLALLVEKEIDRAELGVHLVGAKEMARVNWQYLSHEGSTDVITFDHAGLGPEAADAPGPLHGELFICVDDAVKQARSLIPRGNRKWCAT